MKKSFFYGALAALSLAACSQNEVLDLNRNGDEIKFNIVTNKASRAAAVYDNNTLPTSFKVWANQNSDGVAYFAGDELKRKENETTWTSDNVRYWPAVALDFFAVAGRSNNDLTVSRATDATATSASFTYTVKDNVAAQEDVLYAAAFKKSKTDDAKKVTLNFAHALSQIVFKAKNTNPNLHVVISGVKVAHLNNKGQFKFSTNTGTKFDETETGPTYSSTNSNNNAGSWTIDAQDPGDATYEITFDDVEVSYSASEVKDLTGTGVGNAMLLLPQTQKAWSKPEGENTTASGTFFAVKCRIYNVAGDSYTQGDVQLWGAIDAEKKYSGEEAYVYIPASISWEDGKKYIYTFNFGNGNGGFEPDPEDPNTPDPDQPVLIPIEYTVTVDDFDIVSDTPVEVNGTNDSTEEGGKTV